MIGVGQQFRRRVTGMNIPARPAARTSTNSFGTDSGGEQLDEDRQVRRRVGTVMRRLQHAIVGRSSTNDTLAVLADDLERWVRTLEKSDARRRPPGTFDQATFSKSSYDGQILNTGYDERPFGGLASPFGLDLEVVRRGDTVVSELTFGAAHEGAPGRAHGGIIAGLFDDLTGYVLQLVGSPAFTGELKVRYDAPVPLGVKLVARAWLHDRQGRKLYIDGELLNDGERIATVQSIYITV